MEDQVPWYADYLIVGGFILLIWFLCLSADLRKDLREHLHNRDK